VIKLSGKQASMDNSSGQNSRTASAASSTSKIVNTTNYSSPASPTVASTSSSGSSMSSSQEDTVLGLFTPKKEFAHAKVLQTIREKLLTPGGACELQALGIAAEKTVAFRFVSRNQ